MRIVAVLNQKGGVGKTTTAVNLGAALALRGRRVLLIDADPQGNLTDHLGLEPGEEDATLYDVLTDGLALTEATLETETDGLLVVPSEPDLAAAESELAGELGREGRLSHALNALPADAYDWVLIDCPPSLGLLSINAMAAASELLITLQTEYFALKGLAALNDVIGMVRQHVNPDLALLGILPTLVNPVTLLSKEVIEEVRSHYGDVVFGTRIRQNVSLAEAPSRGTHIFRYRPGSRGAADYLRLADEIEGRRDARSRSHATRVASSKRKDQGLTRADTPAEPDVEPDSDPASDVDSAPDVVIDTVIDTVADVVAGVDSEADAVADVVADVDSAADAVTDVDSAPDAVTDVDLVPDDVATPDETPAARGVREDPEPEAGYRTPSRESAPATPVPAPMHAETPMPPPEPLRTPALEPDTPGTPESPTSMAPASGEIRAAVADAPMPDVARAPSRAMPVATPIVSERPATVREAAMVREATVEVAERPATPSEAPVVEPARVPTQTNTSAPTQKKKTGPVEMDADEARDWFRRAMARRENA